MKTISPGVPTALPRIALAFLATIAAMLTLAPAASAYLYWGSALPDAIGRANLDGTARNPNLAPAGFVYGVHSDGRHVYWANLSSGTIGRAGVDGSNVEGSFIDGGSGTRDVATAGEYVYWSRSLSNAIGRAKLDGSEVDQTLLSTPGSASAIAADDQYLYWASSTGGAVGRANLDGTGANPTFISVPGGALGVAVDGQYLYWTNATDDRIGRANLDGSGIDQSFITGAVAPNGIDVSADHVYWINGATNTIGRANLDGTGVTQSFISGLNGTTGVAVDPLPITPTITATAADTSVVRNRQTTSASATLSGGFAATGTIEFRLHDRSDALCSGPPIFTSTATVDGDGTYTSDDFTPPHVGTYRWVAHYGGAGGNLAATSSCGAAGSTITVTATPWDLRLTGDDGTVGQPLTATATLAEPTFVPVSMSGGTTRLGDDRPRAGAPRGGVSPMEQGWGGEEELTFRLYGPDDATCANPAVFVDRIGAHPTVAGDYTSQPFVPTAPGVYRWTVAYSDAENQAPDIDCGDATVVTVEKAAPGLTLTGASPTTLVLGGEVSASVLVTGGYEPTGELTFALHGPGDAQCTAAPAFTVTVAVDARGMAQAPPVRPTAAGEYRWVVSRAEDAGNVAVTTDCADGPTVTVSDPPVVPDPPAPPPPAPPAPAPPAPSPSAPARPVVRSFSIAQRCVRPASNGRSAVRLRMRSTGAETLRVEVARATGAPVRRNCPRKAERNPVTRRYRTVATERLPVSDRATSRATSIAASRTGTRDATLRLRLSPGTYRVTVRAQRADGRLSAPKRRFLQVLAPRR